MDMSLALALVGATALLVAIPGPNVALIVANTLAHGLRCGAATVLGTTLGVALQLAVVVAGLAVVLEHAGAAFGWLKWAGVVYLLWLGVRAWRQGAAGALEPPAPARRPLTGQLWQGLLLAVINPKTLMFNAAFLPQFVAAEAGPGALPAVAALYLGVLFAGDMVWALSAQSARGVLARLGRLRHRLTGALFIGAGLGLALARVER
jgi:threonine/homoserine/homoserine lactone efflux protein